jgi:hypothetical protein
MWEVEYTDEFEDWWGSLADAVQRKITAAVDRLEQDGPTLPRPLADTLAGSRYPNMKELRPPASSIRVLFAFDPRRVAILLIGGDKEGRWDTFYGEIIPVADRLYARHLEELEGER